MLWILNVGMLWLSNSNLGIFFLTRKMWTVAQECKYEDSHKGRDYRHLKV